MQMMVRTATYIDENGTITRTQGPEIIWPTWPATPQDAAAVARVPLDHVEQYWRTTGDRLRESAKWMATVLGVALATIVGTSPLSDLSGRHLEPAAAASGLAGLVFLSITMTLILRVMQPQAVTFADLQTADPTKPIHRWQQAIQLHPDLYSPCGVTSLEDLRDSMALEEATLVKLVQLEDTVPDQSAVMHNAAIARSARLFELRTAATSIAIVAEYMRFGHAAMRRSTAESRAGYLA